jgi:putative transposase
MDNEEHPDRRSVRLKEYDYTQAGGYFVTVVTLRRECLFGEIASGEMRNTVLGRIVEECWCAIPEHFPNTDVDVFVVMPNHIHGIMIIHENMGSRGTIYRAPTPIIEQFGQPTMGSLPTIIRTFKAAVTRRARRELNSANIWQRNYYEHIIRDQRDHEHIAYYIATNLVNWSGDEENLNRLQSPHE